MFSAAMEEEEEEGTEGIVENCDDSEIKGLFRTGLGKKVEVKQSSIDKARSVLSDLDFEDVVLGQNQLISFSINCFTAPNWT